MSRITAAVMALLASLSTISAMPLNAQTRMKAGQWENTQTRDGQVTTHIICLTQAEADSLNGSLKLVRAQLEGSMGATVRCRATHIEMDDSSEHSTMECGPQTFTTVTTFHGGESAEEIDSTSGFGKYVVTVKKKRLGACPANSK